MSIVEQTLIHKKKTTSNYFRQSSIFPKLLLNFYPLILILESEAVKLSILLKASFPYRFLTFLPQFFSTNLHDLQIPRGQAKKRKSAKNGGKSLLVTKRKLFLSCAFQTLAVFSSGINSKSSWRINWLYKYVHDTKLIFPLLCWCIIFFKPIYQDSIYLWSVYISLTKEININSAYFQKSLSILFLLYYAVGFQQIIVDCLGNEISVDVHFGCHCHHHHEKHWLDLVDDFLLVAWKDSIFNLHVINILFLSSP